MKLSELICLVSFESVAQCLTMACPQTVPNLYCYREAYDLLKQIEPADAGGDIRIHRLDTNHSTFVDIDGVEETDWSKTLSREVTVGKELCWNDARAVTEILCQLTYFGFGPQENRAFLEGDRPAAFGGYYTGAKNRLARSIWKHQIPPKYQKKAGGKEWVNAPYVIEHLSDRPLNGPKRKRKWRQEQRMEYLRDMSAREQLIGRLTEGNSSLVPEQLLPLMVSNQLLHRTYRAMTTEHPLAYVVESMRNYQNEKTPCFKYAVVCIEHPAGLKPAAEEVDQFREAMEDIWMGSVTEIGFKEKEIEEGNLTVQVVWFS